MNGYKLIGSGILAMLVASSGAALAQSNTAGTVGQGASPIDVTCAELASLDTTQASGLVYFLHGYNQARMQGLGGSEGGAAMPGAGSAAAATAGGADAGVGGTGSGTGAAGDATDTAAAASGSGAAGSGSDLSAATETSATSGAGASASAGGATGSAGAIPSVPGFMSLDVAAITSACASSPTSMLTDIISAQGSGAGTSQ